MKTNLTIWENHLDLNFMKTCNGRATDKNGYKYKIASEIVSHDYKSVLDVGAGIGLMNNVLKKAGGNISYTAVEITKKYIEYMKSQNIDCLEITDSIPLEDNSYDCVISLETINHQEDYKLHLDELLRIAKNKVYISFFKKFQEEVKVGETKHLSGKFPTYVNEYGLIEERNKIDGKVVAIYNFINKKKLTEYLDSLNLDYQFIPDFKDIQNVLSLPIGEKK